jgi:hypothetical protein
MKTYFVNYLKQLQEQLITDPVTSQVLANQTQTPKAAKINFCLVSSRDTVQRALTGNSFSALSRIFNGFPINDAPHPYHRDDLAGFTDQPEHFKSYVDRYHAILMNGQEIIFDDCANNLNPLTPDKLKEVNDFVGDLILVACEEILDGAGEVRAKIIQILGLRPLLEAWKDKKDLQVQLRAQLICSYFTQILWGAIVNVWDETKAAAYKASRRDINVPGNLTVFIANRLLGNGASPNFLKIIANFPLYGRPLTQSCAMILTTMPVEEIVKIMIADLHPLTSAQLAQMPVHLQRDWQDAKILFWSETIKLTNEYLLSHLSIDREDTKQNAEEDKREVGFLQDELNARLTGMVADDHSYRAALTDYFSAKIGMRDKIFDNAASYLHYTCELTTRTLNNTLTQLRQALDKKSFSLFSHKPAFPKLANAPSISRVLARWFTVRDNDTIIRNILRDVEDRQLGCVFRKIVGDKAADFIEEKGAYLRLTTEEKKLLSDLDQSRFEYDFSITDPSYVLETFITLCPVGSLHLPEILKSYKDALPKQSEEDIVSYYRQQV